jgi:hypothetical protein
MSDPSDPSDPSDCEHEHERETDSEYQHERGMVALFPEVGSADAGQFLSRRADCGTLWGYDGGGHEDIRT